MFSLFGLNTSGSFLSQVGEVARTLLSLEVPEDRLQYPATDQPDGFPEMARPPPQGLQSPTAQPNVL